jgi:hypothetical protein
MKVVNVYCRLLPHRVPVVCQKPRMITKFRKIQKPERKIVKNCNIYVNSYEITKVVALRLN